MYPFNFEQNPSLHLEKPFACRKVFNQIHIHNLSSSESKHSKCS